MKELKSISHYFSIVLLMILNLLKRNNESLNNTQVIYIKKKSLIIKFNFDYIIMVIEKSKNLDSLTIYQLMGSFQAYEERP